MTPPFSFDHLQAIFRQQIAHRNARSAYLCRLPTRQQRCFVGQWVRDNGRQYAQRQTSISQQLYDQSRRDS
jgi:hypothetical protein